AYLVPVGLRLAGWVGAAWWLPALSLPLAWRLARTVLAGTQGPALNRVLKGTGQLHLLYGLLLGASLLWPR
ncbi:MAG: 1,4-dihydroxy-2-naphthoate polyprenyltransferase, partial [Firmicutes bacterium]|nr:1,4-dihydroxy-2-naphthoate polyprenyltransferase [Bacillota bacterium]